MVSVRFDPAEVELLRQAAPSGNVSRFVREATMREVRRIGAATIGSSETAGAGALVFVEPAGTSAPSTLALSIPASAEDGGVGLLALLGGGPDRGEEEGTPPAADT